MLPGPVTMSTGRRRPRCRRRTSRPPGRRRRRTPRRRRAARTPRGSWGAAGRRSPSAAGWRRRTTRRRRPGPARRSSRPSSGRPHGRRARRGRPARPGSQRSVTDAAGDDLRWSCRCGAGPRARAGRDGSTPRARRGRRGRGSASAESSASCGTRRLGRPDAVELLAPLEHRLGAALVHVLDDGPHGVQHALDVDGGARQHVTRVDGRAPEVDAADHAGRVYGGRPPRPTRYCPGPHPADARPGRGAPRARYATLGP